MTLEGLGIKSVRHIRHNLTRISSKQTWVVMGIINIAGRKHNLLERNSKLTPIGRSLLRFPKRRRRRSDQDGGHLLLDEGDDLRSVF